MNRELFLRRRIRFLLIVFIAGLVLSGVTAIPLTWELGLLTQIIHAGSVWPAPLTQWLTTVQGALQTVDSRYTFLPYGTDWLAFGHLMIAVAFWGPLRDPVRNVWVVDFGLIACALVVPWALVFGALRGIPWWWRLIDCGFGVFGALPLWYCRRAIGELAQRGAPSAQEPTGQTPRVLLK